MLKKRTYLVWSAFGSAIVALTIPAAPTPLTVLPLISVTATLTVKSPAVVVPYNATFSSASVATVM